MSTKKQKNAEIAEASEDENFIIFTGNGFKYAFSKNLGTFVSLIKNDTEQLLAPIRITSMRAPIDNERKIKNLWYWYNVWEGENLDRQFDKVYECIFDNAVITVKGSISGVSRTPYFRFTVKYKVLADGTINVLLDGKIKEKCTWLPRLGFEIKIPYEKYEDILTILINWNEPFLMLRKMYNGCWKDVIEIFYCLLSNNDDIKSYLDYIEKIGVLFAKKYIYGYIEEKKRGFMEEVSECEKNIIKVFAYIKHNLISGKKEGVEWFEKLENEMKEIFGDLIK